MQEIFNCLNQRIVRLAEVIHASETDKNDYIYDAALRRFTLTIELFCKTLKKILKHVKIESNTPKDVLSKAFIFSLIDDEKFVAWNA